VNAADWKAYRAAAIWFGTYACLALAAFSVLFTTWANYDDEGYILWTLIHHSQGHILYDDIYSQYGPAFYLLDISIRDLVPFDYSSDGQRWQTLLFWCATSAIVLSSFYSLQAVANSSHANIPFTWSAVLLMFVFWHQERLALEPGHPQIWCTFLVALCTYLFATKAGTTAPLPSLVLTQVFGLIAGLLIMIKPNVGILLLAALPGIYLWTHQHSSRWLMLFDTIYSVGVIALPWLLTYKQLDSLSSLFLPTIISLALISVRCFLLTKHITHQPVPRRIASPVLHMIWLVFSVFIALSFFVLWSAQRGVSPIRLGQALFGQHDSLLQLYYFPAIRSPIGFTAVLIITGLIAYQVGRKSREILADYCQKTNETRADFWQNCSLYMERFLPNGTQWSLFFLGLGGLSFTILWLDALSPLVHGLRPRGCAELLLIASPAIALGWLNFRLSAKQVQAPEIPAHAELSDIVLTALPNHPTHQPSKFPFVGMALIAILQPLIAFPVPGTQLSLGTLPLVLLLIDGCRFAVIHLCSQPLCNSISFPRRRRLLYLNVTCLLLLTIPSLVVATRYLARESLDLPGAQTLRLSESETKLTRNLMAAIRQQHAEALVFRWHNRPSWYLWTESPPPFHQLPPSWTYLISTERQFEQLKCLTQNSAVLVIDEDYAPRQRPPQSPLQQAWKNAVPVCEIDSEFSLKLWSPKGE
jgi:hypothetical protein